MKRLLTTALVTASLLVAGVTSAQAGPKNAPPATEAEFCAQYGESIDVDPEDPEVGAECSYGGNALDVYGEGSTGPHHFRQDDLFHDITVLDGFLVTTECSNGCDTHDVFAFGLGGGSKFYTTTRTLSGNECVRETVAVSRKEFSRHIDAVLPYVFTIDYDAHKNRGVFTAIGECL